MDKSVEINNKVIELQGVILTLQASLLDVQKEYALLTQENDSLIKELEASKQKNNLNSEYKLTEISKGKFVYTPAGEDRNKPDHWLCSNCFDKGQKSIIQMYNQNQFGQFFQCPNCDHKMSIK